jgi:hypothetical protein
MVTSGMWSSIGIKPTVLAEKTKIKYYLDYTINTFIRRFDLCVDNTDYEASLIPRKVYEIIPDERAAKDDLLRIVDESGEDYLYHVSHFVLVEFPVEVERRVLATT